MAISLEKNSTIDLSKSSSQLSNIHVGLGWEGDIDCDVSVFMINENNKIPGDGFFVFYNNLRSSDGAVVHQGDTLEGDGDGDDEEILIDLTAVDPSVLQLMFVVTIHNSDQTGQDFSMVNNAYIRITDNSSNTEICRYQLNTDFSGCDSVQIGRVYRMGDGWEMEALGDGYTGGLASLLGLYN